MDENNQNTNNKKIQTHKNKQIYSYRCSITYFLTFFLNGCIINYLGASIPQLADQFDRDETKFNTTFLTRGVGYMIGSLVASKIMYHQAFAIGLLVCGASSAVLSIINNFYLFCSIFFVLGLGGGLVEVQSQVFLIWVHGQKVSPWMQALHFLFGAGALLSPIIVAQLNYKLSYFIFGVLDVMVILTMINLKTPKNPNTDQDRKAENYSSINIVEEETDEQKQAKLLEKNKQNVPLILSILIALLLYLYVGSEVSFGGWISTFLKKQYNINKNDAAYGSTIFWGAIAIGRLIAIPLSKIANKNIYQLVNYIGCILSICYMIISDLSKLSIYIGAILFGMFMASIYPFAICFPTYMNMNTTAIFTSICTIFAIVGEFSIPYITGFIMEYMEPKSFIYTSLILTVAQILLFGFIYIFTKTILQRKSNQQIKKQDEFQNPEITNDYKQDQD